MSSRLFWVAVGAVGGVYAYRRGQRAVVDARERGLVGNVAAVAGTVSRVAGVIGGPAAPVADLASGYVDHSVRRIEPIEVVPVRRIPVSRARTGIPSTAMRLDALTADAVVDLREVRTGTRG